MANQPKRVDDGGPAFPQISFDEAGLASKAMQGGVSVRDYFAAAALQGFFGNPALRPEVVHAVIAKTCYEMADAMLAERQKEQS